MHFARINTITLHYRLAGPATAPVLVLVNSLGTDARIWDGVIELLAQRYRLLSYDKRGHGLSDAPPGDYTLDDHLDDLLGLIDHLDIDQFALCGVSVGGLIAMGAALRSPARVTSLTVCNSAPKVGDADFWAARMAAVRSSGMEVIADGIMERWFSPAFRYSQPEALTGWRNMFLRADPVGYVATCATLRNADLTAVIRNIAAPTLVIAGEADLATPLPLVRACADAIPGARFHFLPGGHIPSIEAPETLASLIQNFVEEASHG